MAGEGRGGEGRGGEGRGGVGWGGVGRALTYFLSGLQVTVSSRAHTTLLSYSSVLQHSLSDSCRVLLHLLEDHLHGWVA